MTRRRKAIALLGLLLLVVAGLLFGCGSSGGQTGLDIKSFGDRIGANLAGTILFGGRSYVFTGTLLQKVKVTPDDLSFVGGITEDDGSTAGQVSSNGRAFAIQGVDKSQAIAVRFESANGVYFYYLEYRAAK